MTGCCRWLQPDAIQNYIVLHGQTAHRWCRLGFLALDFLMWLLMGYCWSLYHIFLWGALCRTTGQTILIHNDRTGRTFQSQYQEYDPQQWLTQSFVCFDVHKRWTNMCDSIYIIIQFTDDAVITARDGDRCFVALDFTNAVKLGDSVPFFDIPAERQRSKTTAYIFLEYLFSI